MAPTLAELDARAKHWPRPGRWLYLAVKWSLVALGAWIMLNWYLDTWGWQASLWFLLAPFVYGIIRAWPSTPTGPEPETETDRPPSRPASP